MKASLVVRSALIAGAAILSAACSADNAGTDISAPRGPSALAGTPGATAAGVMQVCVDAASPAGNYHFTLGGATNIQAGDVVAVSPMAINTTGAGPVCGNALTRTGAANSAVATIGVTASIAATGVFSFVCVDDFGGSSCNPASGVNNARAGESSFHGSTITFKFVAPPSPIHPAAPPPPPPPPIHPAAPPPPPPPPIHPAAPPPAPPESGDAVFVIGDMGPHGVGASVYFWGSQWWKNNGISGDVSNGVASFKGYAVSADDACGGTWRARVGNSASPPETISGRITVIVTSSLNKSGPNISGDILEILSVDQDGTYGTGNHGTGVVASINCAVGTTNH